MGGQRSQVTTCRTKSEAEEWARGIETAITKGSYLPTFEAKRRTVRDLHERYEMLSSSTDADCYARQMIAFG